EHARHRPAHAASRPCPAAARALPVQDRRDARRAVVPDRARNLAARAQAQPLPSHRAAAAPHRRRRFAGHSSRHRLTMTAPNIVIPDDFPVIMATSAAYRRFIETNPVKHYDTLPGSEAALIERIRDFETVL